MSRTHRISYAFILIGAICGWLDDIAIAQVQNIDRTTDWPRRGCPPRCIQNVDTANVMVNLCIGGSRIEATSGATGGTDVSFRSLDVKGDLNGELSISKSSAKGLIKGLDKALRQVKTDQANKVRACLEPVRERLLAVLLPPKVANPKETTGSPAITKFDGTYAFVSAAKVNESYLTNGGGRTCPDLQRSRPELVIAGGQAHYASHWTGTVGPEGELHLERPLAAGPGPRADIRIFGRVDDNGTVRARGIVYGCSYDLIWQKLPK
jgi:hypothetical protein